MMQRLGFSEREDASTESAERADDAPECGVVDQREIHLDDLAIRLAVGLIGGGHRGR